MQGPLPAHSVPTAARAVVCSALPDPRRVDGPLHRLSAALQGTVGPTRPEAAVPASACQQLLPTPSLLGLRVLIRKTGPAKAPATRARV